MVAGREIAPHRALRCAGGSGRASFHGTMPKSMSTTLSAASDEDIGRLDVPVQNSCMMRRDLGVEGLDAAYEG
jgi:hypothetical protein